MAERGLSSTAVPRNLLRRLLRSRAAFVGLSVGVILFIAVIAGQGIHDVSAALGRAGWGIIAIALLHIPPLWADAMGWRSLLRTGERSRVRDLLRARWIGESINDLLPVLQMGGNVVKVWLLTTCGIPSGRAWASVVVDVTLVVATQILFTLFGLALLWPRMHEAGASNSQAILLTAGVMALLLACFYVAQRHGFFSFLIRLSRRILRAADWKSVSEGAAMIDAEILTLHAERRRILASASWHILSWVFGVGEVWYALRLLGSPVDLPTAFLFESLGQAVRTGAFAVPGGLGVQEGGYVLVGTALGIDSPVALALSLARRVRELLLGLPGLAVWISSSANFADRNGPGAPQAPTARDSMAHPRWEAGASPPPSRRWKVRRSLRVRPINAGGRLLGKWGMASLDEDGLLEAARRKTGLADFGDAAFRDPLRRLIDSLETESRLNVMGRLATRYDLINLLANRLRMVEDRKREPGIARVEVRRPIIITGLPRTGTTLLHRLMSLDPRSRVPMTWETRFPSPPPEAATYETDARIITTERQIQWFHHMVNDFNRIHPIGATLPEECLVLFSPSFLSYQFETTHRLPTYLAWLEGQDLLPAYRAHREFLQQLEWKCPRDRWVLKAPAHMFSFEAMFAVYPDARVVMTHRNPIEVTASNASLTATLRSAFSDEIDPFEVGPECSGRWADALHRAIRSRDRGCAPAEQFLDIQYVDLIADPIAAVRKVYEHFGMSFPDRLAESIVEFNRRNPRNRFGSHRYSLEDFGLTLEGEEKRFAAYRERFRV